MYHYASGLLSPMLKGIQGIIKLECNGIGLWLVAWKNYACNTAFFFQF